MDYCRFSTRARQDLQIIKKDTFYGLSITSTQSVFGTEKHPDSANLSNYDDGDYFHGHGQIKEAFRASTKDDILNTYISDLDFRSSSEIHDIGYSLFVFDMRYQKNLESAQPIKVKLNISENIPVGIYGYALVLTNSWLT